MRRLPSLAIPCLAALCLGVFALAAAAHEYKFGELEVVHPWVHAPLKGSKIVDGFMKIINHGTTPDRLLSVSVEFAAGSQIHDMKMEGNVMKMAELKDGIVIPAGATVELKPQSLHVMFMDLKEDLIPDEMVNGELVFEKAGKLKVEFMVEPATAQNSMDMD